MKHEIKFGDKYGRWNVIVEGWKDRKDGTRRRSVWCVCECGNVSNVAKHDLTSGRSVSCGCYQKEQAGAASRTHALSKAPEYKVWQGMKGRCHNPSHADYCNYGARGISVCDEWRDSFEQFIKDMGNRPSEKHTIERIDNDKGYCKDNCCWLLRENQQRNRRKAHRKHGTSPLYEVKRKVYLKRKQKELEEQNK
jgi:hypothetical protein